MEYISNRPIIVKTNENVTKTLNTRVVKQEFIAKGDNRTCHFRKVLYIFDIKIKTA